MLKDDLRALNLRRELNERVRFVKKRLSETIVEFQTINGARCTWPKKSKQPPDWAYDACRFAWETGLGDEFKKIGAKWDPEDPRATVRHLIAMYEGLYAYVSNPAQDLKAPKELNNAIRKLHAQVSPLVPKSALKKIRELDSRFEEKLGPATHDQLLRWSKRQERGLKAVQEDRLEGTTDTNRAYYAIWFFWPKLVLKPFWSAAELHKWLIEQIGLNTSIKTIEAVHTKLKFAVRHNRKSTS